MHRFLLPIFVLVLPVSTTLSLAGTVPPTNVRLAVPQLKEVTLNPASVGGGAVANGTITLLEPAGTSGVTVKLQSSAPSIAAVPASAFIQPGSASATFLVQTYPVAGNPNVVADPPSAQISASIGASAPKTATLTVRPATLASLTFEPSTLSGGTAATGTIAITSPAPAAGLTVTLSTEKATSGSGQDVRTTIRPQAPPVTVPQTVTVPGSATMATFSVPTKGVPATTAVQIVASYGPFISRTATLTLLPPSLGSLTTTPPANAAGNTVVIGGQQATGKLTLTAPAPAEGMSVALSVSPNSCPTCIAPCGPPPSVPAAVQIAGGSTTATFPITTAPGRGFHLLRASDKTVAIYVRDAWVTADSLIFPSSVKGGTLVNARLKLDGTVSTCGLGGHYKLQTSNSNLAQVPSEVTIAPGASEASFSFTTTSVPNQQTVDISVYYNNSAATGWQKKTLTLTP